jgi:lysophospholipase L1-like esterase
MPNKKRAISCLRTALISTCMAWAASTAGAQGVADVADWSAAWQAPQSDAFLSISANRSTVRQILTTHAAGELVRLRFSNFAGAKAVQLGAVTIGVSAGGAAISAAPVPVPFAGQPGVVLAPGGSVYSDPVRLPVQSMQRLAVSIYIPGSAASLSRHFNGNELVWSAPGDASGQAGAQGFTQNANLLQASTLLVDRLEVSAKASGRVVAMFGDSITDGFMGSASGIPLVPGPEPIGRDLRFPDFLQRRADAEGVAVTFVSAAISGNRLLAGGLVPMFGPAGQERLDRDVLTLKGVTDAFVLIGINDLGFSLAPRVTGPALVAHLDGLVQRLHDVGLRVTVGTLLPSRGATLGVAHGSAAVDAARQSVNQWIRTSGVPDAVVDFDPCMQDPARPTSLRPTYSSGDGLHPNGAGYQAMAACVGLNAFR